MKKATFRVREIRTFEFDMYFDEYLSLANMEKAAEEKWWSCRDVQQAGMVVLQGCHEAEPVNVLVGIKRDEFGDVAVRRIAERPTPDVKLFWAKGSYCTTSGNMRDFNFAVRDVSLEGASRRAEQMIKGDKRRRYSGKMDMEVCAAGNY